MSVRPHISYSYMKLSLQFLINAARKWVKQAKYLKYLMKDNVSDHAKLSLQFLINAAHKCVTRKKNLKPSM